MCRIYKKESGMSSEKGGLDKPFKRWLWSNQFPALSLGKIIANFLPFVNGWTVGTRNIAGEPWKVFESIAVTGCARLFSDPWKGGARDAFLQME